jgi:hypothetical protein
LAVTTQVWDNNLIPVSDQEHGRSALTVDEQSQLAAGHFTQPGQFVGLFAAVTALTRITAAEDAIEKLEVAGFEATGVADDFSGYKELLGITRIVMLR